MTETATIDITVNGEARMLARGDTIADLLRLLATPSSGIAVAVNDEVVRKHEWSEREVSAGDRVEVITATAGG